MESNCFFCRLVCITVLAALPACLHCRLVYCLHCRPVRVEACLLCRTSSVAGSLALAGPDAGVIRCTVDGAQTKEIETLCKFSGFNYPVTIMFFNELENGDHTLELEILENRPGRMKAGGTALRVIGFTAN